MILYFVFKNKKSVTNEKILDFELKINETEEQKVAEIKDHEIINVAKLDALISSDIYPVVGKISQNKNVCDGIMVNDKQTTQNHTIEVRS